MQEIINSKTLDIVTCKLAKHLLKNLNKPTPTSYYKFQKKKKKFNMYLLKQTSGTWVGPTTYW